jgi:hypothetical protein
MRIDDKPGLELIAEFQDIEIDIKVLEKSDINGDFVKFFQDAYSDDPLTFFTEWRFELKFNKDFTVQGLDFSNPQFEYKDFISKKLNAFFREIGDVLEADSQYAEKLIFLNDYKTKFTLISEMYAEEVYPYCNLKYIFLNHNNIRIIIDSDKNISEHNKKHIIHSFLTIQKQVISNILFFLDSKIEILREIGTYELNNVKSNKSTKKLEPIDKMNKFQSALLFNYLQDNGAIHPMVPYKLAPLISQLTGHSEQKLRTEAFSNLVDVKKGKAGDKTQLQKDPDINLKIVKDTVKSILKSIDEDLEKNRKLRESKKL